MTMSEGGDSISIGYTIDVRKRLAGSIMKKHEIAINDLHSFAKPRLPHIMKNPGDVHFTAEGYSDLSEMVTDEVQTQLPGN